MHLKENHLGVMTPTLKDLVTAYLLAVHMDRISTRDVALQLLFNLDTTITDVDVVFMAVAKHCPALVEQAGALVSFSLPSQSSRSLSRGLTTRPAQRTRIASKETAVQRLRQKKGLAMSTELQRLGNLCKDKDWVQEQRA